MSVESIIEHILEKANKEKDEIIQKAEQEKEKIIEQAKREAEELYEMKMEEQKALCESEKQKLIVNTRLEAKKNLLKTKQELIEEVFDKLKSHITGSALKKERVKKDGVEEVAEDVNFYIDKIRFDYESEIAKILFG